jgi:hypothetical protein
MHHACKQAVALQLQANVMMPTAIATQHSAPHCAAVMCDLTYLTATPRGAALVKSRTGGMPVALT